MKHGQMQPRIPQDEDGKRRLVLKLITRLRCPGCSRLYDPEDFALVHRRQDAWVLGARCRHCGDLCHVVVFMTPDAEPEPPLDLTPEELQQMGEQPPISIDDVLDVHVLLQEFDGNFEALFTY